MRTLFEIVGSISSLYIGVRLVATVVDICQRWRTGNWEV